jgi:hypothetical protein
MNVELNIRDSKLTKNKSCRQGCARIMFDDILLSIVKKTND